MPEREPSEAGLRRREFLERTAYAAGLAGMASVLPASTLLTEAAKARATPLPQGPGIKIDHFVVVMQENRSFDHYLGWLDGADGMQDGLAYPDPEDGGALKSTHRLEGEFQGCGHPDPDHSWEGGRAQVNGGAMDGFLAGRNDEFAIGYYAEEDLPFLPAVAQAFTTCDHYFCSVLAPTIPNRTYQWGAQSDGIKTNGEIIQSAFDQQGLPWPTIFDRMANARLEARYFASDIPASALWGPRMLRHTSRIEEFYARAASGTLPQLSFVDPLFGASFSGEPNGVSADEHPHGDVRTGQAFLADVAHAFLESPNFATGALFINYDEWGGFFDHVSPPLLSPDADNFSSTGFNQLGIRVPCVCISPFARRGFVSQLPFDHTSILALIERRFELEPLTKRDAAAKTDVNQLDGDDHANIGLAFDFTGQGNLEIPDLPHPLTVLSKPCATSPTTDGIDVPPPQERPEPPHAELRSLLTSGYLERVGFEYRQPSVSDVFREPDGVRRALRSAG